MSRVPFGMPGNSLLGRLRQAHWALVGSPAVGDPLPGSSRWSPARGQIRPARPAAAQLPGVITALPKPLKKLYSQVE